MMFSVAAFASLFATTVAFSPNAMKSTSMSSTSLNAKLNGWVPDESKFACGLPGAIAPYEEGWDPLGFAENSDVTQMKAYREAETTHGRVAMLAVVGFLITEEPIAFHPLFNTASLDIGPAIRHLDEVRITAPFFFEILALVIGGAEFTRALTGWESPGGDTGRALKEDYFPGDIGFDPFGLKPESAEEFAEMSTKELQNGRLAMIAVAGIFAQELVNGKEIFVNLGLTPDTFDPSSLPVQFP
mmetsp:Transcript_7157/g.8150  ORF Transcript_7157/g.8150 Transcript_7157/m.8150 type:complete len:243 (-) Transcript_7157:374-1102(-)